MSRPLPWTEMRWLRRIRVPAALATGGCMVGIALQGLVGVDDRLAASTERIRSTEAVSYHSGAAFGWATPAEDCPFERRRPSGPS